jgi:hypothetical protein
MYTSLLKRRPTAQLSVRCFVLHVSLQEFVSCFPPRAHHRVRHRITGAPMCLRFRAHLCKSGRGAILQPSLSAVMMARWYQIRIRPIALNLLSDLLARPCALRTLLLTWLSTSRKSKLNEWTLAWVADLGGFLGRVPFPHVRQLRALHMLKARTYLTSSALTYIPVQHLSQAPSPTRSSRRTQILNVGAAAFKPEHSVLIICLRLKQLPSRRLSLFRLRACLIVIATCLSVSR